MKIILFFFSFSLFAAPLRELSVDPLELQKLTSFFGIEEGEDVVESTQALWLRKRGQMRWEMESLSSDRSEFVISWADQNQFVSLLTPLYQQYDKVLILGSTTKSMYEKLRYLKDLQDQGIKFQEIIWLTGERVLDPAIDDFFEGCKTETDAARYLWNQCFAAGDFKGVIASFVSVPKDPTKLGIPNTEDTIVKWLEGEKKGGRFLFISMQPFCHYQFSVIKTHMPSNFDFEVVGPGSIYESSEKFSAVFLDALARFLYQQKKIG